MKQSGMIAQLTSRYEQSTKERLKGMGEIYMIALLISANDELKVGPGRAPGFLEKFLEVKTEIALELTKDVGDSRRHKNGNGDPEFLKTKNDLAKRVRQILGRDGWIRFRDLFPLLSDFYNWEDEPI